MVTIHVVTMDKPNFARMYQILYTLFFTLLAGSIHGTPQTDNPVGSVSGIIIDSITRNPVEYAAVGIEEVASGKIVNGGLTDANGAFSITELPAGEYYVQINFIGFTPRTVRNITLTQQQPDFNCGTILLSPSAQLLEEIQVLGEAALIEAKPDKIVYNAERDVTSAGGDASDVLRKVPLLTVDFDGNVSMRGSENVKILINGRPSGMFNNNPAEALKMMPADQIKSIEIITSPTAKYDGEGTAGIINIITKKKNIEGVAGSVDLTVGTRSNRANGNVNYGKGRLGINASGGGHYSKPQNGATTFIRDESINGTTSLLAQDGTGRSSRLGYRINLGAEYNLDAFNSINSEFSIRTYEYKNRSDVASAYRVNDELIDSYERIVDGINSRSGWDWEAEYKRTFPRKDQEWSIATEVDHDDHDSDFEYEQFYLFPLSEQAILENNLNKSDNLEITVQTDYAHPFSEKFLVETGLKGTIRHIESDFSFATYDPDLTQWIENPERTDVFYYDQNVYAAYGSASMQIGKEFNLITGVRMEITSLKGEFKEFISPFQNDYLSVLPNLIISKKMGQYNQLKLSYNQRIQRPNQRHINPFIQYNDNRDISYGNPSLFPELVHQVELGTNVFLKGNMINATIFARRTEDLIENLLTINDEGISESTYYNFGQRSAFGINLFGSLNLGESFTLRGGFDVNAWKVDGEFESEFLTNTGYDYNGRLNMTWSVNKSLRVEGFGFFRSPYSTVQGKNPSWSMMSFGLKQELFKRRLTIGINITEPFRENLNFIREIEGTGFYQYSKSVRPVRSFGINLGYRFGKLDFNERSGRKGDNNNDLKNDDQPVNDQPFQGG